MTLYATCEKVKVKQYFSKWSPRKKEKVNKKHQNQHCHKYYECVKKNRIYCKCTKGLLLCSGLFEDHKVTTVIFF